MTIVTGGADAYGALYNEQSVVRPPRHTIRKGSIEPVPFFYAVGVDLGSVNDSTAISVVEVWRGFDTTDLHRFTGAFLTEKKRETDLHFIVKLVHRPRLGTSYPLVIDQINAILEDLPNMPRQPILAVDATGLGAPVVQQMRKQGVKPVGITITAGQTATLHGSTWQVPKGLLVGELRLAMHRKRLKVAQGFSEREQLQRELEAFTARLSASGRATFEAAGSEHDDTVLSLSLAIFAANNRFANAVALKPSPFSHRTL